MRLCTDRLGMAGYCRVRQARTVPVCYGKTRLGKARQVGRGEVM